MARLIKQETGVYKTQCGKFMARKERNRWVVYRDGLPRDRKWATLKEVASCVSKLQGIIAPAQIRPLKKGFRVKGMRMYYSRCNQFAILHKDSYWIVLFLLCNNFDDIEKMAPISRSYLARHGLDLPLATLKEAIKRLETAVDIDPIERLLENR